MIARGGRYAFAGHRPVGRVEGFRIHERAVPPESRGARRATCGSCSTLPNQALHRNLRKWGSHRQGEEGASRVTLTSDSPSARPAREVAGVKAVGGWVRGKGSL